MLPYNMVHLTPLSPPTPEGIVCNFMEREPGLFWQSFKTEIKFEQKNACREKIWSCPLIVELLYFVLFYLVSIASGKVFSIHELISGVLHVHNPLVFPQHLKDNYYFRSYCIYYIGFFSSSKNHHETYGVCCICL